MDSLKVEIPVAIIKHVYTILHQITPTTKALLYFYDSGLLFMFSEVANFVFVSLRIDKECFVKWHLQGTEQGCEIQLKQLMYIINDKLLNPDTIVIERAHHNVLNIGKEGPTDRGFEPLEVTHPTDMYMFPPQPCKDQLVINRYKFNRIMARYTQDRIDKVEIRFRQRSLYFRGFDILAPEKHKWFEFDTELASDLIGPSDDNEAFGVFWVHYLRDFSRHEIFGDDLHLALAESETMEDGQTKTSLIMSYPIYLPKKQNRTRHNSDLSSRTKVGMLVNTLGEAVGDQIYQKKRKNKKPGVKQK